MFKVPKPEYTAEFKELAVKRVKDGQGIAAIAKDLGLKEKTLRNSQRKVSHVILIRGGARISCSRRFWTASGVYSEKQRPTA